MRQGANQVSPVNLGCSRDGVENPYGSDSGIAVYAKLTRHFIRCDTGRQYLHNERRNKPEDAVRIHIPDLSGTHKSDIRRPGCPGGKLEECFRRGLTQSVTGTNSRKGI